MARTNAVKREQSAPQEAVAEELEELEELEEPESEEQDDTEVVDDSPELPEATPAPEPLADIAAKPLAGVQDIDVDACLNALKTLLTAVEKLQKVRQEIGDIKPLLVRMLDGEVVSGEELEQLKSGVAGMLRLVRAYSDHQTALANAQPARDLLDNVLKGPSATQHSN